jgi:hypothetical protein
MIWDLSHKEWHKRGKKNNLEGEREAEKKET